MSHSSNKLQTLNERWRLISAASFFTHPKVNSPAPTLTSAAPPISAAPANAALISKNYHFLVIKLYKILKFIWIHMVWLYKHWSNETIADILMFSFFFLFVSLTQFWHLIWYISFTLKQAATSLQVLWQFRKLIS